MKIAIIYDWIDKWGGVERVLLALQEIFPKADFFTSYYDEKKAFWAKNLKIKTTFIQKLPFFVKKNRLLSLVFYPFAFESLNFDKYNLVISITSSFAKGIITKPKTTHICYLLTPTRFLWVMPENYGISGLKRELVSFYFNYLKKWDLIAAQRPDKIISISKWVADRCLKYYRLPSEIIYPPFDLEYWLKIKKKLSFENQSFPKKFLSVKNKKYFLVVSRLEKYKRLDLVIDTFNQIDDNLIIVGEGSEERNLKKRAKGNIYFYKNLTDTELGKLYLNAEGLIMPQEEDFGYVSLEAQFFGCPVIALKRGGATETIFEGKTGLFFKKQDKKEIIFTIERFKKIKYNLRNYLLKKNKILFEKFSLINFKKKFKDLIKNTI